MTAHTAEDILDQVMSWPGVTAHEHQFGGGEFRLGNRQLGHLHGDRTADIPLKREQLLGACSLHYSRADARAPTGVGRSSTRSGLRSPPTSRKRR